MIGEIEALKAGLKNLRAQRNELLKDPAGWYAIKCPQTSRNVPVPKKYCKDGKGVVRNQKEARAHIQWAKKEDLRLNSLILQKKKEIRKEENQIKSNLKADLEVAASTVKRGLPTKTLVIMIKESELPRLERFAFMRTFFGERKKAGWKPENGLPKADGRVFKDLPQRQVALA